MLHICRQTFAIADEVKYLAQALSFTWARGVLLSWKTCFLPTTTDRVSWHRPPSEIVRVNVFVLQESVEEEPLGDVTDGEKCGQAEPLGPKYPHVLKSLQQGWSAGGGLEMHVWLGFSVSWYFKACFALTQWVFCMSRAAAGSHVTLLRRAPGHVIKQEMRVLSHY